MARERVLYVVASDWYFCCHRLSLAKQVARAGFDVHVATPLGRFRSTIEDAGLHFTPIRIDRQGRDPAADIRTITNLARLYARLQPDLIHHVALKPIVYGTLAARMIGIRAIVNAMPGMGYVFLSDQALSRAIRPAVKLALRLLVNAPNVRIILQNRDDIARWVEWRVMLRDRIVLIRGAGVDISHFVPTPEQTGAPLVILPARLLYDKGVREFVDAARIVRSRHGSVRFALVGEGDPGNPSSVQNEDVQAWVAEGVIESFGWRDDMASVLSQANVVCLPSYGEGLPKALLEAAATARAIVTTDVPGCREIVVNDENGLLVPPRDSNALAAALERVILDPALRERMGRKSRERAVAEFSADAVADATIRVYEELLGHSNPVS